MEHTSMQSFRGPSYWATYRSRQRTDELARAESLQAQQLSLQARELKEQRQRIDDLEAINAELRMFAATAAHDLKSPLTTIIGFATIAERELGKGDPESVGTCLGKVRSAAERMGRLVIDLQDLASLGCLIDEPVAVLFTEAVDEAVDQLAGPIAERGVEIAIRPSKYEVMADRGALVRVMQNLIENGIRYMGGQSRPRIEIVTRRDGGYVLCSVRDNGAGIAPDHQRRIFEPFERIEDRGGCGLGLYIVRRLVEAHGGRVWVDSEGEGHGSRFCFTLPATG